MNYLEWKSLRSGKLLFADFEINKALKNTHQGTNIYDENRGTEIKVD